MSAAPDTVLGRGAATAAAPAGASSPLLNGGSLNGRTVKASSPADAYENEPCCTPYRAWTSASMGLATVALGVGFIPGVPVAISAGGGAYLVATGAEAVNSYLAQDRKLQEQLTRFDGLLKGFGVQVNLLGKNEQDIQKIAEEMQKLFQGQQEKIAAFQQREDQADQGAATTAQARLEEAVRVNQQMAAVLGEVCGTVDRMKDLAASKVLMGQGAAVTQTRLQDTVIQLSIVGGDISNQLAAMQRATDVFQSIQAGLSTAEASFNDYLGKIMAQVTALQKTTGDLRGQVAALNAAEAAVKQNSDAATARLQEEQAASTRLKAQLKELKSTQEATMAQLEGKVKLFGKALQIASRKEPENAATADGDKVKQWLAAAQAELATESTAAKA